MININLFLVQKLTLQNAHLIRILLIKMEYIYIHTPPLLPPV